jgi:hypothetical protein
MTSVLIDPGTTAEMAGTPLSDLNKDIKGL